MYKLCRLLYALAYKSIDSVCASVSNEIACAYFAIHVKQPYFAANGISVAKVCHQASSTESVCSSHLHATRAHIPRRFAHLHRRAQNMTATEIGTHYKVLAFISLHFLPFPFPTFFVAHQPSPPICSSSVAGNVKMHLTHFIQKRMRGKKSNIIIHFIQNRK